MIVIGEILYFVQFFILRVHYQPSNEELTMHQSQLYNKKMKVAVNVIKISSKLDITTLNAFTRQMANAT